VECKLLADFRSFSALYLLSGFDSSLRSTAPHCVLAFVSELEIEGLNLAQARCSHLGRIAGKRELMLFRTRAVGSSNC